MALLRILTNFQRFPVAWTTAKGLAGSAQLCSTHEEFFTLAAQADLLLVNCDLNLTEKLCLRALNPLTRTPPIVAADLVLRYPDSSKARFVAQARKLLLSQVSHFIHYFRHSPGYERYFGISPDRSSYVPFKPNLNYEPSLNPGEYVLCFGRSLRDYDTFIRAVSQLPYPAAIPQPDFTALAEHRSRFTVPMDRLPPNLRLLDDDGSLASMTAILDRARLVVLPVLSNSLAASGLSVYLNAMRMRKCVVLSEGPGASDVLLEGQALLVPPENPAFLANVIRQAWEDEALRQRTATLGHEYALSLGGEAELYQRILECLAEAPGKLAAHAKFRKPRTYV